MNEDAAQNPGPVTHILSSLIERSGALTALLVSKEGMVITEAGDTSYLNTTAMAALVAGMFSAQRVKWPASWVRNIFPYCFSRARVAIFTSVSYTIQR